MELGYQSEERGRDFTIFFDHKVDDALMRQSFRDADAQSYLIWDTDRRDGMAIAWLQTKVAVDREFVLKMWFPWATWAGTTCCHNEFDAWFRDIHHDRWAFEGRYRRRLVNRSAMPAAKEAVLEIIEEIKALHEDEAQAADTEDDEEPGVLVRTTNIIFPLAGV